MIFLFKDDGNGRERLFPRDIVFNELRQMMESFPEGTLVGRFRAGEIDDRKRVIRDAYLEIFYVQI